MYRYRIWRVLFGLIWLGFGISGCTRSAPATPIPTVMKYPFVTAGTGPTHEINEPYPKATTTPSHVIPPNTPTP